MKLFKYSMIFILITSAMIYLLAQTDICERYFIKSFISSIRSKAQHNSLRDISSLEKHELVVSKFPIESWVPENRLELLRGFYSLRGESGDKKIGEKLAYFLWLDLQENKLGVEENLISCNPEKWERCDFKFKPTSSHLYAPMNLMFGKLATEFIEKLSIATRYCYNFGQENVYVNFVLTFKKEEFSIEAFEMLNMNFSKRELVKIKKNERNISFIQAQSISVPCFDRLSLDPFPVQ